MSYETVSSTNRGNEERGLLPTVLESVLRRRLFFKTLQQSLPFNTTEWFWCEQRINTLKSILVSLYGTSGSFWNRFANVLAFEEINRLSREVLIKTKDVVQDKGFELLYADTDFVFLKKHGASFIDFEHLGYSCKGNWSSDERNLLLYAAETVLGHFGFSRTDYGDAPNKNKWWYSFAEERIRDRDIERV